MKCKEIETRIMVMILCEEHVLTLTYKKQTLLKAQSFVTKKVHKISHHFYYDSKCSVYFLSWKMWDLQYVGSTVDRFHLRWNNYKCSHRVAVEGGTTQHFMR